MALLWNRSRKSPGIQYFMAYVFDEQHNSGQLSVMISEQSVDEMNTGVNAYPVDTTSMIPYNSDYERQTSNNINSNFNVNIYI